MKTFRMIGIALFAVLMSVNFASCNEEELPQYELITGEKKIVRIEIDSSELGNSIWEFNYDSKGRLLEATCSKGQENEKYNYAWSNNSIKSSNGTYYLSDGLIHNWENYYDVTYSSETGRATKIGNSSSYTYNYTFVWDSNTDGLSRRDIHYKEENRSTINESFAFSYGEDARTCSNYNPIFPFFLSDGFGDILCVAHPELVNARSTVLPNNFTLTEYWFDENGRLDYETIRGICNYKFDSDGYITEITMNENSSSYYAYKTKYTIIWE